MAVVYHDSQNDCLTVIGIGTVVVVSGCNYSWATVIGHVLRFHWEQGWGRIFNTKCTRELEVTFE